MGKMNVEFLEKGYIERENLKQLLSAGLMVNSFNFVRRLCLIWLEKYRGDLEIQKFLGQALIATDQIAEASQLLEKICKIDPEYVEAQELYTKLSTELEDSQSVDSLACVYAMGKTIYSDFKIPEWSFLFRSSWQAYLANQFDSAEQLIRQVLVQKPNLALAAILHQRISHAQGDSIASIQLANIYHNRFPLCLNFKLIVSDSLMGSGNEIQAVELLRECAANDSFGVVSKRIWGEEHPYSGLWPDQYRVKFDLSIPAEVASYMGWNNLPQGELRQSNNEATAPEKIVQDSSRSKSALNTLDGQGGFEEFDAGKGWPIEDPLTSVDEIFNKLSKKLKNPDLVRTEGKYPVYLILSTKSRLIERFGKQTFLILDTEMRRLATEISKKNGWRAMVFYPDDAANAITYGLSVVESVDPWAIKNAVADLDRILAKKGEMIGALLIVGGPEVVPYHKLPNPTDDFDDEVASDNPYATLDGNYFVPEWPVGRLPGSQGNDAGLILSQLRVAISQHSESVIPTSWLRRLLSLVNIFKSLSKIRKKSKGFGKSSFGMSAAVWFKSSISTFRPISGGNKVLSSPPEYSGSFNPAKLSGSMLEYFNLHGLEDSADWYGQREIGGTSSQSDYPVALSPKDIVKNGKAPEAVLSEACYGGYIDGKTEEDSLALKFMGIGTKVYVGSTSISYGSIDTPLIGADLLANYFWKNIRDGHTAGEAFANAKLEFVKEMNNRQGFLDGEDQKTLISFVLFGDPLMQIGTITQIKKSMIRRTVLPRVKIMSDQEDQADEVSDIPRQTLMEVKKIAENYLPGLEELKISVTQQYLVCDPVTGKCQPKNFYGKKGLETSENQEQTIVTISKTVPMQKRVHHHYLRAKVDKEGKLIKLAISR